MEDGLLVRPLAEGPLDVVGDVHGELDSLHHLLAHLGYDNQGEHPAQRRLVFLGDLVDRGPDSPGVVAFVRRLVEANRADCVLGNHELNLLHGKVRSGNAWFFGQDEVIAPATHPVPARRADERVRTACLDFFRRLPIVLERPDLGIVHACWDARAIDHLRGQSDVLAIHDRFKRQVEDELRRQQVTDPLDRSLCYQNGNPVKLLTSGPEHRTPRFFANGKWREEGRRPWWREPRHGPFCVFGHYWRRSLDCDSPAAHLFSNIDDHRVLGDSQSMCIDYSVGKRWLERFQRPTGPFVTRLAALRWPERLLVYDDGTRQALAP